LNTTIWDGFNSGSGFTIPYPKGTIQPSHWYQLKSRFERIGAIQFNWDIELNDYGTTGTQFVSTVLSARKQEIDSYHLLDDTTLYGGFGVPSMSLTAAD